MSKTFYIFDETTREYLSKYEAQCSPLQPDEFISPTFSTEVEPLSFNEGYSQVFDGSMWQQIEDNRGLVFDIDGQQVLFAELGVLPEGLSKQPPPDSLDKLKSGQVELINSAFESACKQSVIVDAINYSGGIDNAIKFDAIKRFNELAGLPNVTFIDKDNIAHILSYVKANQVVLAIAADYQTKLNKKNTYLQSINQAANSQSIQAIIWTNL